MKITIIGTGNMGCALGKAVAVSNLCTDLVLANRSANRLKAAERLFPMALSTTDIASSVADSDIIIVAVKPYAVEDVMNLIAGRVKSGTILLSVAAGVTTERLRQMAPASVGAIFYAIPNTAVSVGKGITFISHSGATVKDVATIMELLNATGEVVEVEERLMGAATALCSCGIAYVYDFIQAGVQAGVQMGIAPDKALAWFTQTVAGAAAMLQSSGKLPQEEINAVTTPGGMTIKGVNMLAHTGFHSSVIKAITEPLK